MLIIGDVDAAYFTMEQRKWIVEFVDDGGGLVMLAGRQNNPASYLSGPIGKILPVEFEARKFAIDENQKPSEFVPKLSELGRREAVMMLGDTTRENDEIWRNLPAWYWHYPVTKLKPAAQSLLDHPSETVEDPSPLSKDNKRPMPLIARQFYGKGIVMFVGSDETWRWRFNEEDKYFARFWGQVVYQLGLPRLLGNKTQLTAETDFLKGKPTRVYARLFTKDDRPLDVEKAEGTIEKVGAKGVEAEKVVFQPVEGQPGLYVTTITKDQPGDYMLKLPQPQNSGETIGLPVRISVSARR